MARALALLLVCITGLEMLVDFKIGKAVLMDCTEGRHLWG